MNERHATGRLAPKWAITALLGAILVGLLWWCIEPILR